MGVALRRLREWLTVQEAAEELSAALSEYSGSLQWTRAGEVVASIQMRAEDDAVVLSYRHRRGAGDWQNEEYPIRITRTACALRGLRPWFLCPASGCERRVAVLYGGSIFACRLLPRSSLRERTRKRWRPGDTTCRQAQMRLGWEPGILNRNGDKPKWMRWRTFERLTEQHDQLADRSMCAILARFGAPGGSFRR